MISTAPSRTRGKSARPPAARVPHLAHLGLDALRAYRQELIDEEAAVSYWRRLVHARIVGAAAEAADGRADERLRSVLADHQRSSRRRAVLAPYDGSGTAPMPDLAALWETAPAGPGESDQDRQERRARLATVEAELSAYRHDLHHRLDEATAELIARYRDEPALALRALPHGAA